MKKILFIFCAITALMIPVTGQSLTFNIDTLLTGNVPTGDAPWLTLTFSDISANTVQLVIQSDLNVSGEYILEIAFNVNPLILPSLITFTFVSKSGSFQTPSPSNIKKSAQDAQDLNPGDNFDIDILFATSGSANRFNLNDSITYNLTYPDLTEDSFKFFNTEDQAQYSGFYAVAKFQGSGGKLGDKAETVPEPTTLLLLGIGLIGLAGLSRRKFLK